MADALDAFRDWLRYQLRDAGCEIRTLSPEGMAEVTVRRFAEEGWRVLPPGACCDLHGRNCEYNDECCWRCTEAQHFAPGHGGVACSAPDLSASTGVQLDDRLDTRDRCPSCSRPVSSIRDQGDGPTVARQWLPCGCTRIVPAGGAR